MLPRVRTELSVETNPPFNLRGIASGVFCAGSGINTTLSFGMRKNNCRTESASKGSTCSGSPMPVRAMSQNVRFTSRRTALSGTGEKSVKPVSCACTRKGASRSNPITIPCRRILSTQTHANDYKARENFSGTRKRHECESNQQKNEDHQHDKIRDGNQHGGHHQVSNRPTHR